MLVTGMLLADSSLKAVLADRRIWLVTGLRLVLYPLVCLGLLRLLALPLPGIRPYALVSLLAAAAPAAGVITHICQIDGMDSSYASAICVMTTTLCALTMPLMVWLHLQLG